MNNNKPKIAELLRVAPDFTIDLKWEFDSFIPLVGSLAPSGNTYLIKIDAKFIK